MTLPSVAAVIDTNVLISALIGHPSPATNVLKAFEKGHFSLVTSEPLLRELRIVTLRPEVNRYFDPSHLVGLWETLAEGALVVTPASRIAVVEDPVDNALFATAAASGARCVVTGDRGLLRLKKVGDIVVMSPRDFLAWLARR